MPADERKRGLRSAVEATVDARLKANPLPWWINSIPAWARNSEALPLLWNCIDSLVDEAAESEAILREFMTDVEAAGGPKVVGKDWPDLVITYNKARMLFKRTEEDHG